MKKTLLLILTSAEAIKKLKTLVLALLTTAAVMNKTEAADTKVNPFERGWCTWAAAELFNASAPQPGVNWGGHAGTWLDHAKEKGWQTTTSAYEAELGAIVVWTGGEFGHVAVVTKVWSGGFRVTEMNIGATDPKYGFPRTINFGNWTTKDFTVSKGLNRNGQSGKITLWFAGFILPNRPPAIGTMFTQTVKSQLQLDVALMDEDGGNLRVLAAIVDGGKVVLGTSVSVDLPANRTFRYLFPTKNLRKGKNYTVTVWVWDFKDQRSTKSVAIRW